LSLVGENWKNTRAVAADEYGMELPLKLPPEFSRLN
jgi:hypothetical protein